ncbi:MAG: hypothetical protein GVY14_15685 [Spirochaetes bacterium]|nr:hypothetical protein [Spirochaetota bacterium]
MKPFRPKVLKLQSLDEGSYVHLPADEGPIRVRLNGRRRTWPDVRNRHPKLGLAVHSVERLLLIGGLGDPGTELGRIDVYDGGGRLLRALSLGDVIPDLDGLSRAFSDLSNFPRVSTLEVEVTESIDSDIEGSLYAPYYKGASRDGEPRQAASAMSVMVATSA